MENENAVTDFYYNQIVPYFDNLGYSNKIIDEEINKISSIMGLFSNSEGDDIETIRVDLKSLCTQLEEIKSKLNDKKEELLKRATTLGNYYTKYYNHKKRNDCVSTVFDSSNCEIKAYINDFKINTSTGLIQIKLRTEKKKYDNSVGGTILNLFNTPDVKISSSWDTISEMKGEDFN